MTKDFSINSNEKKPKIEVKTPQYFQPSRLTFNFSFLTDDKKYNFDGKGFNKPVQKKLIDKIVNLSGEDYDIIMSFPKEIGFEKLDDNIVKFRLNSEFKDSGRHQDCLDGFWIFRLSKLGRVIGKIFDKTFYILCIDTTFDTYKHSS